MLNIKYYEKLNDIKNMIQACVYGNVDYEIQHFNCDVKLIIRNNNFLHNFYLNVDYKVIVNNTTNTITNYVLGVYKDVIVKSFIK